jgi:beta-carotene hydroxylase
MMLQPGSTQISLQLSAAQRLVELARPWAIFALYLTFALAHQWWLAIPAALATCLAAFVQMHDTIHRSLGLSKKGHELMLSLSALLLLKSGHGLQITHLRHHGRCLAQDDPEGACAHWPFYRVMLQGPFHILAMRLYSLRTSPNTRRIQLIETAATGALLILALAIYFLFGSPAGLVYWAVAAALSATMPLWAAYLPHRLAPRHPAVKTAARFARIWTPVVNSFAYHHAHHAFPKIPTVLLPVAARQLDFSKADFGVHEHQHHSQPQPQTEPRQEPAPR